MTTWMAGIVLESILNGVLQGIALTAAVSVLLRLVPRTNAATRYAVWLATLAVVVCLPWLGLLPASAGAVSVPGAAAQPGLPAVALLLPEPGPWVFFLAAAWALVSLLLIARVAWSYRAIIRMKKSARPLDRTIEGFRLRRKVRLMESGLVSAPLAAGISKPVILIPAGLAGHLTDQQFQQVLMHEAAHIRRFDDWTNLAQKLVEAVLFFHPAVAWIGRKLNLEREIACDDWVVAGTGQARPYAACLTRLVELSRPGRSPQLAHGAVTRKRQITRRVESLLSRRRNPSARFSKAATAAATGALAVAAAVAVQVAPVRVAEPPIPAIGSPAAAEAPAMAYARPPKPVAPKPAPVRRERAVYAESRPAAPPRTVAPSRPSPLSDGALAVPASRQTGMEGLEYFLIERWIAPARDGSGGYCVYYFGGTAQAVRGGQSDAGWFVIRWCAPASGKASLNQA